MQNAKEAKRMVYKRKRKANRWGRYRVKSLPALTIRLTTSLSSRHFVCGLFSHDEGFAVPIRSGLSVSLNKPRSSWLEGTLNLREDLRHLKRCNIFLDCFLMHTLCKLSYTCIKYITGRLQLPGI